MVLNSGTGPLSIPTYSPNLYERGVTVALIHDGNATSVSSMTPVYLMVSL